ncbi:hypothetical protein C8R45DRAFT_1102563 [Mycena sanguinolenta]|nr:hypothetical protein C8R45DRAFT_1102563 [Mycena sanguinolenta]
MKFKNPSPSLFLFNHHLRHLDFLPPNSSRSYRSISFSLFPLERTFFSPETSHIASLLFSALLPSPFLHLSPRVTRVHPPSSTLSFPTPPRPPSARYRVLAAAFPPSLRALFSSPLLRFYFNMYVLLRSPSRADIKIKVSSPSRLAIIRGAREAEDADSSWDVGEPNPAVVTRPGSVGERSKKRKELHLEALEVKEAAVADVANIEERLLRMENGLVDVHAKLQRERRKHLEHLRRHKISIRELILAKKSSMDGREIIEKYETASRIIQGTSGRFHSPVQLTQIHSAYNVVVFDTARGAASTCPRNNVISWRIKNLLKKHDLGYLTYLLKPSEKAANKIAKDETLKSAHATALAALSLEEQQLCLTIKAQLDKVRKPRNAAQHPRPDAATTLRRAEAVPGMTPELLGILRGFLETDPLRLPAQKQPSSTGKDEEKDKEEEKEEEDAEDLRLFAPPGLYESVEQGRAVLAKMEQELAEVQRQIDEAMEEGEGNAKGEGEDRGLKRRRRDT